MEKAKVVLQKDEGDVTDFTRLNGARDDDDDDSDDDEP